MKNLAGQNTDNIFTKLGRNYLIFCGIVIMFLFIFCLITGMTLFKDQQKILNQQIDLKLQDTTNKLNISFRRIEDFFQFTGEKYINSSDKSPRYLENLFKQNIVLDSNIENIYISTKLKWVNNKDDIEITASKGILPKPFKAPLYYPLEKAKLNPWHLQISNINTDNISGFSFIPVAMSINDVNENYIGTIIANILADNIYKEINSPFDNKDSIHYLITDQNYNLLFSSFNLSNNEYKEIKQKLPSISNYPIYCGDIILTSNNSLTDYPYIIFTGYNNKTWQKSFKDKLLPYIYLSFTITFVFLSILYIFRKVAILPVISSLNTDLKKQTAARIENDRMLAHILTNIPGFIYRHRVEEDKVVTEFISEGCLDVTGYSKDEYISDNQVAPKDVIKPEYLPIVFKEIRNAVSNNRPYEISYPIITKTGQTKWVLNQGSPEPSVKTSNGFIIEGILTDITDIKNTEKKMQEMVRDLEISNHELEKFAHICSHDLKEPLRTIFSYIQLFKNDNSHIEFSDKSEKYLEIIESASLRMKELIENILLYSTVGSQPVKKDTVDLNNVVSDIKYSLHAMIMELEAKVEFDKLPSITGDEDQISRLFQNIICNAFKFCDEDIPPIVKISSQNKDGKHVIAIKDNGIGIDESYHKQIFNLFERLNTQDKFAGTGIGLAICKRIIERHRGKIWLESKQKQGTTFYVMFDE